jgi:hypothetical protein
MKDRATLVVTVKGMVLVFLTMGFEILSRGLYFSAISPWIKQNSDFHTAVVVIEDTLFAIVEFLLLYAFKPIAQEAKDFSHSLD